MTAQLPRLEGWASTQLRNDGGSIDSEQSVRIDGPVVENTAAGAARLGRLYWLAIARTSHGLVRARGHGDEVELRLTASGPVLLRFDAPELEIGPGRVACRYPIAGGLLARRRGGDLVLSQLGGDDPGLHTLVSGFFPRLGPRPGFPRWSGPLYALVQQQVHLRVSRGYFRLLLSGHGE